MIELLNRCNEIYGQTECCHGDPNRTCYCMDCLQEGFYGNPDWYNCLKKLCSYTMNYGPCYTSEIYNYLQTDRLLENNYLNQEIKVLSLGCGFCPDWFGINKYIIDNNLPIIMNYTGIEEEPLWGHLRVGINNAYITCQSVLNGFSLSDFDIVIIDKLFSTLKANQTHQHFLQILLLEIQASLKTGAHLIFSDTNHQDKGRDEFDIAVSPCFTDCRRYKFNIGNAYGRSYQNIDLINNIIEYPQGLAFTPKPQVTKSVVFVYRR